MSHSVRAVTSLPHLPARRKGPRDVRDEFMFSQEQNFRISKNEARGIINRELV